MDYKLTEVYVLRYISPFPYIIYADYSSYVNNFFWFLVRVLVILSLNFGSLGSDTGFGISHLVSASARGS